MAAPASTRMSQVLAPLPGSLRSSLVKTPGVTAGCHSSRLASMMIGERITDSGSTSLTKYRILAPSRVVMLKPSDPAGRNAYPPRGRSMSAIVSTPANGTVVNNGDGTVTYTPNAGFFSPPDDTFTYTVGDLAGNTSNAATVTVTVNEVIPNQPPVANDDSATTDQDTPVTIDVVASRLVATPFEKTNVGLRCSVTGVTVRLAE